MRRQQSGFTLVEIAIVLVIIGLLLGGILKGQELINSAKAKSLANDFRTIPVYVYTYQDKFRAIPGDDAAANTHLTGGTVATAGGQTPGNGRIEGAWNSTDATSESVLFWQHVRLAQLASGDTTAGQGMPTNTDGGRVGITSVKPIADASFNGSYYLCSSGIRGRFAKMIDAALDDGKTAQGSVRVAVTADGTDNSIPESGGGTIIVDDNAYVVCQAF